MPDIFPESRDEAILLSMINGEEYTGFPESRIEVLLLQLKATLEDWKSKTKGAYVFHGSVEFSELPSTLTEDMVGWTYNMLEEFTTDDRFVDGAGKVYPAGTNVAIANVGTDETPVLKFDVTSAFVDVNAIYSAIDNIADMIADEFDEDEAYAVGDIVWYVDDLYTFVSPHTAGDPWSNLEANMTTVDEIINAVYSDINNTISDIEDMIANQFNAAIAYSEGEYVIYQNGLYKFTSDHAAGAAWDPFIVSSINVTAAIKQAESDLATLSEYFAAMTNIVSDLEDQVDTIQDVLAEALTKTASGNPITITDCAGGKARSLKTTIEAIQDLHGYDHPWAGGAGKNKLPMTVSAIKAANTDGTWSGNDYTFRGVTWTIITDSANNVTGIKANGTASGGLSVFTLMPNTPNIYNGMLLNGGASESCRIQMFDQTIPAQINSTGSDVTITFDNNDTCRVSAIVNDTTTANNVMLYPMIRNSGESATFAPYSNICPISGRSSVTVDDEGKNRFSPTIVWKRNNNSSFGGATVDDNNTRARTTPAFAFDRVGTFTLSGLPSQVTSLITVACFDSNQNLIGNATISGFTFTTLANTKYIYILLGGSDFNSITFDSSKMQIEEGSTATAYVPYVSPTNVTIQLGQTVYGAEVDFDTGVVTVTDKYKDITKNDISDNGASSGLIEAYVNGTSDKANGPANMLCNVLTVGQTAAAYVIRGRATSSNVTFCLPTDVAPDFEAVKTWVDNNPIQLVYKLATPTTLQLTPAQLELLKGYNRVSIDNGSIELGYTANVQAEVDVLETTKADNADVVDYIENGNTASRAYTANQFMLWKGDLYKVTTSIASGATITAGTNVSKTTIGAVLTALLNS